MGVHAPLALALFKPPRIRPLPQVFLFGFSLNVLPFVHIKWSPFSGDDLPFNSRGRRPPFMLFFVTLSVSFRRPVTNSLRRRNFRPLVAYWLSCSRGTLLVTGWLFLTLLHHLAHLRCHCRSISDFVHGCVLATPAPAHTPPEFSALSFPTLLADVVPRLFNAAVPARRPGLGLLCSALGARAFAIIFSALASVDDVQPVFIFFSISARLGAHITFSSRARCVRSLRLREFLMPSALPAAPVIASRMAVHSAWALVALPAGLPCVASAFALTRPSLYFAFLLTPATGP